MSGLVVWSFTWVCLSPRFGIRCRRVARSDELQRLAGADKDLCQSFRFEKPGRVVADLRRDRRLRHARADFRGSELAPAQSGEGFVHGGRWRAGKPPAGAGALQDSCGTRPRPGPGHRRTHAGGAAGVRLQTGRHRSDASRGRHRGSRYESKAVREDSLQQNKRIIKWT